jgi:hypothetical protein
MFPREFAALQKRSESADLPISSIKTNGVISPTELRVLPRAPSAAPNSAVAHHYTLTIDGKRTDVTVQEIN